MKTKVVWTLAVLAAIVILASRCLATAFGTLSNFDVVIDPAIGGPARRSTEADAVVVATNPQAMNSAFSVVPQAVNIPVPVWHIAPVPAGNGVDVNVRAEVEPVEEENHARFGEPQWMKVFKIETELDLEPDDLVLLLGSA